MRHGKWQWHKQQGLFRSCREWSGSGRAVGIQGRVRGGQGGEGRNQDNIKDSGVGVLTDVGSRPGLPARTQGALSSGQAESLECWHGTGRLCPPLAAHHRGLREVGCGCGHTL